MHVVRLADAPHYTLPDHEQVTARRLQGVEAGPTEFAVVGHSVFPPGAVVPMGAGPIGKIYVVAEGVLTIEQADGVHHGTLGTASSSRPARPVLCSILGPYPPR